jgi:hypothetical protein
MSSTQLRGARAVPGPCTAVGALARAWDPRPIRASKLPCPPASGAKREHGCVVWVTDPSHSPAIDPTLPQHTTTSTPIDAPRKDTR